jgi:hypothetical protein
MLTYHRHKLLGLINIKVTKSIFLFFVCFVVVFVLLLLYFIFVLTP